MCVPRNCNKPATATSTGLSQGHVACTASPTALELEARILHARGLAHLEQAKLGRHLRRLTHQPCAGGPPVRAGFGKERQCRDACRPADRLGMLVLAACWEEVHSWLAGKRQLVHLAKRALARRLGRGEAGAHRGKAEKAAMPERPWQAAAAAVRAWPL